MNRSPRIAVIGSVQTDLRIFGQVPQPGETRFAQGFTIGLGGTGANQAVAAKRCGAEVFVVACTGRDLLGETIIKNFETFGIDTRYIRAVPDVTSGVASTFVDPDGWNRSIVVNGANDQLQPDDVDAAAAPLAAVDVILVSLDIPLETVYRAVRIARAHQIRCLVNPTPSISDELRPLVAADSGDAFIGSFAVFLAEGIHEPSALARARLYDSLSTVGAEGQPAFLKRAEFEAEWAKRGP